MIAQFTDNCAFPHLHSLSACNNSNLITHSNGVVRNICGVYTDSVVNLERCELEKYMHFLQSLSSQSSPDNGAESERFKNRRGSTLVTGAAVTTWVGPSSVWNWINEAGKLIDFQPPTCTVLTDHADAVLRGRCGNLFTFLFHNVTLTLGRGKIDYLGTNFKLADGERSKHLASTVLTVRQITGFLL